MGVQEVPADLLSSLINRPARSRAGAGAALLDDHAAAKPWWSDAGPHAASCSLSSSAMVSRLLGTFLRRMTATTGGGATSVTNLAAVCAFAMTSINQTLKTVAVSLLALQQAAQG